MNIVIISYDYSDERRAVFTFVAQLVEQWAKQGHNCWVIAPYSINANRRFHAHNDWLELAVNQGLLGIIVYAVYWKNVYKEWRHSDRTQPYSLAFGTLVLGLFVQSLFSMSYGNMEFYSTMLLGYCMAQNHNRKNHGNTINDENSDSIIRVS